MHKRWTKSEDYKGVDLLGLVHPSNTINIERLTASWLSLNDSLAQHYTRKRA